MTSRVALMLVSLLACRPTQTSTSVPFASAPSTGTPAPAATPAATVAPEPGVPDAARPDATEPRPADGPPQPLARRDAHVAFVVSPRVGAATPSVSIDVHNTGQSPITIPVLEAPCFAHFMLSLRVVDRKGRSAPLAACKTNKPAGANATIAPGEHHRTTLALVDIVGRLARGVHEIELGWDPTRLRDALGPEAGFDPSSTSLNITEFAIARPLATVRVPRGTTKTLPGGAKISFAGNSHKHMSEGDGPGPLGVGGSFTPPGRPKESFDVWVHVEDSRFFALADGHTFELVDSAYDEWIEVRYFGKIAL